MKWNHTTHSLAAQRMRRAGVAVHAAMCCALMCTGCERESEIRTYRTPKESNSPMPSPAMSMRPQAAAGESAGIAWDLPAGWTEAPGDNAMRFATLTDPRTQPNIVVTVTKIPGQAGSVLANVNRWRGQLGLAEVSDDALDETVSPIPGNTLGGLLVDLIAPPTDATSEAKRMLAAMYEVNGTSWFLKAVESQSVIDAAEGELLALYGSVRADRAAMPSMPTVADPLSQPNLAGSALLTFDVPDGWREDTNPRPARVTTLIAIDDAASELAVTRFSGDVGGELANVNRWLNQLGLPPVAAVNALDGRDIEIGGEHGREYRLTNTQGGVELGMLVAFVQHDGHTWFFKMNGTAEALDAQRERFDTFLRSVSFQPAG